MAHILTDDGQGLSGLSTAEAPGSADHAVSYRNIDIFSGGMEAFLQEGSTVKVTRAYTNPVNALQSIAFCSPLTLRDGETGGRSGGGAAPDHSGIRL